MTAEQRRQDRERRAQEQRARQVQTAQTAAQTAQQGQDRAQTVQQEQGKQKEQDFRLYGKQGFTAQEVEVRYKETMESLKREQEQGKGLSPQEKYRALQEQNKEKMARAEQERQSRERGGKER
jgi:hypothetical protein